MARVIVVGGGLAGMACAAALASAGFTVELHEAGPRLGGRAGSILLDPADPSGGLIDNCQHILLGCCRNLLDFYRRLGVADLIRFYEEFYFVEPGGRTSVLRPGRLPSAARWAPAFLKLRFLGLRDKLAVIRALAGVRRQFATRTDLDAITMLDWLRHQHQPEAAVARFWRPVLISAINEEPDRAAAHHGLQVFRLALLAGADAHRMGVPAAPLSDLYALKRWRRLPGVTIHLRSAVRSWRIEGGRLRGVLSGDGERTADFYVSALPFDRLGGLAEELKLDLSAFQPSPITGIHLWFDRPVMDLPQAALLDRTIQWVFNKGEGRYLLAVVSASRSLLALARDEVISLALDELKEFFPRVGQAHLEYARVVKEARATFSARPGLQALRPTNVTRLPNLFLAGDWTRTGWPATMEGAVRSGYLAAEAVTKAAGTPRRFLIPDPAP